MKVYRSEKGQAMPPKAQPIGKEAFDSIATTEIRWLGNASLMMNSRGTTMMIDPVLEGFDMPLLFNAPITCEEVPSLDAVLVTHIDNDHFSRITLKKVKGVCKSYHAPHYVASQMEEEGIAGIGHDIDESFMVNDVKVTLTPAWHNWQSESAKLQYREWKREEYCGYYFETKDGTIWLPGDSRLLEEHLHMPTPDLILLDFSDNTWHITLKGAIQLANTYPEADLVCIHWGSIDAPDFSPFNGNPEDLVKEVVNPERIKVLAPGEAFTLVKKTK